MKEHANYCVGRPAVLQVVIFSLVLLQSAIGYCGDYYVSAAGSDANVGTQSNPWRTLQHAADVAVAGDAVFVQPGAYAGFMSARAGTATKPITFKANGAGVILNSRNPNTVDIVNIENWSGPPHDYITVDGFEITGSTRAGVRIINSTGVVIKNNDIHHNGYWGILTGWATGVQIINNITHDQSGGNGQHGIYISNSSTSQDNPIIRGNITYGNRQNGIQLNGDCGTPPTDGWIDGFTIDSNLVYGNGWKGLSIISARNGTIQNNVIYNNGPAAGGIHLVQESDASCPAFTSDNVTVVNNTVVEPSQAAIRITGGNRGVFFNNILISSSPWVNEYGGTQYHSIASSVEQSTSAGLFVNASGSDFHPVVGSMSRNRGIASYQSLTPPLVDRDGVARPQESVFDAGAYEFGPSQTTPQNPKNLHLAQ